MTRHYFKSASESHVFRPAKKMTWQKPPDAILLKDKGKPANPQYPERCPICELSTDDFVGDHCHATGRHREWICRKCNAGLGMFLDQPEALERAAAYLRKHRDRHRNRPLIADLREEYARCHPKGAHP